MVRELMFGVFVVDQLGEDRGLIVGVFVVVQLAVFAHSVSGDPLNGVGEPGSLWGRSAP